MADPTQSLCYGARTTDQLTEAMRLIRKVRGCTDCLLHKGRAQAVFGQGSLSAHTLILGEAPGANEDRYGIPFCGMSGELLRSVLEEIDPEYKQRVFISNTVRCRPPKTRDPFPAEVTKCQSHLEDLVTLLQPGVILAVGRVAGRILASQPRARISRLREESQGVFRFLNVPVMFTFHPAYIRRNPHELGYFKLDVKEAYQYGTTVDQAGHEAKPSEGPSTKEQGEDVGESRSC